ncbi:MAG: LacI family DNA-binding transcriptional regulator [Bacteroidales bacterium]|nr:LacI family DNA-binding transcriptional regulator [Bacteroidales bacterium]
MVNIRQSDIAKELNISRVTVSKALRDHPDISKAMKKKIIETAGKMGYVPNLIARQLNSRRTFTIGIVVPDLENSFFSYVVDSMIDYATEHSYHVILTVSREKERIEKQNIENLIGMRVDGLLVCLSQETKDSQMFDIVRKMNIPLVFFDRAFKNMKFSRVVFNDKSGAASSLNRIIEEGYSRLANFAGFQTTSIGKERAEGFTETLSKHKIPIKREWIIESGFELKDGYESFRKLNSSGNLPEVIYTVNDRVALGAYKAAKEAGLRIPEDIGIFGFGFVEITDSFDPQLTVINQDPRKMGLEAAKLLIGEIEDDTKRGKSIISIDEEFLWRKSVKRKMGK